jgi:hypothetical protein
MLRYFAPPAAAAAVLLMFAGAAQAKPCRDAAGKFTACPTAPVSAANGRCRAANGQFTACPAPAARAATGAAVNTAAVASAGATARCRDGSMSFSQHRAGTCAGHGGVGAWLQAR